MATYSLTNFLATLGPGDTTLKIYDKDRRLRYEINPDISYFFTESNVVIIRIEDKNDIYLDFINILEASTAASQLNNAKTQIITPVPQTGTGELSENEQRKLAYFHALSKTMTGDLQKINDSLYKSAHNMKTKELWSSEILPCQTYTDAVIYSTATSIVTLHANVTLTMLPNSSGQAWYFSKDGKFIRPWIAPVDVPFTNTNLPSNGFTAMLFRGSDATSGIPGSQIGQLEGAWITEYYAGIIHFALGNTPSDLGWGTIKATFFEYTGVFGIDEIYDAFTSVVFNTSTNQLIFNSGLSTQEIADLSSLYQKTELIPDTNINMTALDTTGNYELACNTGVTSLPITNSYISVYINGIQVAVGNGVRTSDCYFSTNGVVAKTWTNIEIGDKLYWNSLITGYSLNSATDKISFIYLTQ